MGRRPQGGGRVGRSSLKHQILFALCVRLYERVIYDAIPKCFVNLSKASAMAL